MSEPVTVEDLVGLPLLGQMADEGVKIRVAQVFLDVSEEIDLDDGEPLMQEGYMAFESGYVLVRGSAEVEKEGRVLSEVSAPTLLGEMSQFKLGDTRTATVRAKGEAVALGFRWDDLYERAKQTLAQEEHAMLLNAIEQLVWDRFGCQSILDVALFRSLSDGLKLKVCIVFPWIAERETYGEGDVIFEEDGQCQFKGRLLTRGAVKLTREAGGDRTFTAPNIIGIMPKHEPELQWSARATAQGDVEILAFSWREYGAKIRERLTSEERRELADSMKQNAAEHFWH